MTPLFLIQFRFKNKRDPLISELTEDQKLQILRYNMACEDKLQELQNSVEFIQTVANEFRKQIATFKPLVDGILTDYVF